MRRTLHSIPGKMMYPAITAMLIVMGTIAGRSSPPSKNHETESQPQSTETSKQSANRPTPIATTAPGRFQGPHPLLGFAINAHHISDLDLYLRAVDEIKKLGANTLLVVTPMFQDRVDSTEIRIIESKCPTRSQLLAILTRAHDRGMTTMLLPIVLLEDPGDKDWRGVIQPKDWDAWWNSYSRFMDYFVKLAVAANVDILSVGSELNTTETRVDRWTKLISQVRWEYNGVLTYSSNWDRYDHVRFWNLLDLICISSYFELTPDNENATQDEISSAWGPIQTKLLEFATQTSLPLLLGEVGYPSLSWASAHPWNYVAGDSDTTDHEAQARCWRAFFEAWSGQFENRDSSAAGFIGYHWDPYHQGQDYDTGYGINGKPARQVIIDGIERIRRAVDDDSKPNAATPIAK